MQWSSVLFSMIAAIINYKLYVAQLYKPKLSIKQQNKIFQDVYISFKKNIIKEITKVFFLFIIISFWSSDLWKNDQDNGRQDLGKW